MEKVSLIKGDNRYDNITKSLNLLKNKIQKKIKNKKHIVIKPNCVSDTIQLASTHVDAIKAVLDFLPKTKITIAEGSAYKTKNAFKNFNYYSLKKDYDINFVNLNSDDFTEITAFDQSLKPLKFGISKTMLNADCIISLALLKTHDSAMATFSIKNVAVGSLIKKTLFPYRVEPRILRKTINRIASIRNDKTKIHQGPKAIHKNIFEIYKHLKPTISIIDAYESMQGNGPISGEKIKTRLALTSTSAIAADCISSKLIGINPKDIGYLYYITKHENFNPDNIKILGNTTINKEKIKFKMHDTFPNQLKWKLNPNPL